MQKFSENIEDIEKLYKDGLNDLPVDTNGMWESFEKSLPNTPIPKPNTFSNFLSSWKLWTGLSVITLAIVLTIWQIQKPNDTLNKTSSEIKQAPLNSDPKQEITKKDENSTPKTQESKNQINNKNKSNTLKTSISNENKSIETLPSSENISTENSVKPNFEEKNIESPKDSASSDLNEFYKNRKGSRRLFK